MPAVILLLYFESPRSLPALYVTRIVRRSDLDLVEVPTGRPLEAHRQPQHHGVSGGSAALDNALVNVKRRIARVQGAGLAGRDTDSELSPIGNHNTKRIHSFFEAKPE